MRSKSRALSVLGSCAPWPLPYYAPAARTDLGNPGLAAAKVSCSLDHLSQKMLQEPPGEQNNLVLALRVPPLWTGSELFGGGSSSIQQDTLIYSQDTLRPQAVMHSSDNTTPFIQHTSPFIQQVQPHLLTALHSPDGPPHLSSRTPSFILQVGGSPSSCGVAVFSDGASRLIQQDVISPTSTLHPLIVQPHLSNNAASPCLQVPPHSLTVQPLVYLPAQPHFSSQHSFIP